MCRDPIPLGIGQIALCLNDEKYSRFTQLEFLLFGAESLARQDDGLIGGVGLSLGLNDAEYRSGHLLADVVLPLLHLRFILPPFQEGTGGIRLRRAVANGDGKVEAERVVGILAPKSLAEGLRYAVGYLSCR